MSDLTVIAFYPGSGGNRLRRLIEGKDFSKLHCSYDKEYLDQLIDLRYLLTKKIPPTSNFILTHCLNYSHIINNLSPKKVLMINFDYKQSLQRGWALNKFLYKQESQEQNVLNVYKNIKDVSWPECNKISDIAKNHYLEVENQIKKFKISKLVESAWEMIKWHHDYYSRYPVEVGGAELVSNKDFSDIMKKEFSYYENETFNFCWNVYNEYGPTAPILTLYNDNQK